MVYFLAVLSSTLLASIVIAQTPNASFNQSVVSQVAGEIDPGTKGMFSHGLCYPKTNSMASFMVQWSEPRLQCSV